MEALAMDDDRLFEFDNRYYGWCITRSEHEIRSDFPLLKAFFTGLSPAVVAAFQNLPLEHAIRFGKYLIRRRVSSWLRVNVPTSNTVGLRQQARMRRLYEARKAEWQDEEEVEFERIWERVLTRQQWLPLDTRPARRKVLRTQILERFPPEFGPLLSEAFSPGVLRAALPIGDFRVFTFFDTGGNFKSLEYWHDIHFGEQSIPCGRISLSSYLGLASGTMWTGVGIEHEDPIIQCALGACREFLEYMPELLNGL
jgi:hypothetical protein